MRLNTFLIEHSQETSELDEETKTIVHERAKERLKQMTFYATGSSCLRARILGYFGEEAQPRCGNCSVCTAPDKEKDVTREAGLIISGVISMQGRYGKAMVAKVLAGSRDERIRERGLSRLSAFGSLRHIGEEGVRMMIDELIIDGALEVTQGDYPRLKAGPGAREVLLGDEPVRMALPGSAAERQTRLPGMKPAVDKRLVARLSELRKRIAQEQHVPPFIIFTNATLKDMAIKRPKTRAAMLRVDGVGEGKMERYGDAFIRAIARYEEEEA